ncbi:TetR/AcrR family transcriptional regulator [Nocardioides sp. GY 10127]|uniref:TetR/AcrR family transcriptional regulator n=1 Tax=Nocardioides sp. GY 10127 TaxID=2569762 RepID=UPI0010A760E1|nr:TetR/AcrR family transcriptional regulator [Nocardioides sp. GY 10127]TIC80765.1 TetR/AcrR family transcriptional regulator [Nocardioides sp. GY 10127]
MTPVEPGTRPRVEGDRESEILAAGVEVLLEVGFDRLTMDAVAQRAQASKATLYRRWGDKASLVAAALARHKGSAAPPPDTGSLREDLRGMFCASEGLTDPATSALMGSVVTAIARDPQFATAFRTQVVGPKVAASRVIWERARERGDLRPDADLDLLESALAGIVLHRAFVLGEVPDEATVTRVIDQVVLPAALAAAAPAPSHA